MSLPIRPVFKRSAAALVFAAISPMASAMPPDQLYARLAPSVLRVIAYDAAGKPVSLGSGVVIARETVLTNCHVVAKAKYVTVNKENVRYNARLQYVDPARDMCQLAVANLPAPAVEIADSDRVVVGQRVYALGNPQGLDLTLSDGLVSGLRPDRDKHPGLIQTTAPISPGSSGGGLFDEQGRLIGVTTMYLGASQNLNFAVPINWLRELPARSEVAMREAKERAARAGSEPPRGEQVSNAGPAPTPAPKSAPAPAAPYADINDLSKFDGYRQQVREAYQAFLTRPLPRAFAVSENGGSFQAWSRTPKDPADSPDPAIRVISGCEKFHHSRCHLYAVDRTVVYRPGMQ